MVKVTRNGASKIEENDEHEVFTLSQVKELLKIHESSLLNFFNNTVDRIEKKMEKKINVLQEKISLQEVSHKKEMDDLKKSLEFHQEVTEESMLKIKDKLESNVKKENMNSHSTMSEKMDELEDRSRRNNLRFSNIEEDSDETWLVSENKIRSTLENLGVENVNEMIIERAHRTGKFYEGKQRVIVAKFLNYKDKELVMNKYIEKRYWLTKFYINEDFSAGTVALRKDLFKKAKVLRDAGNYARVNYRSLIVKKNDTQFQN